MYSFLKVLILLSVTQVSFSGSVAKYKSYNDYKLFEVQGDQNDLQHIIGNMKELDENLFYNNGRNRTSGTGTTQILVAPNLTTVFEEITNSKNVQTSLLVDDYSKIIRIEKPETQRQDQGGFSWTAYYDVDDIYDYLRNMSRVYADWTQLVVGGESYEGRQILGLRINTPDQREGKPTIFIESGIHAREWITPATTTYFINQLLTSTDANITALRNQYDWHIFPTVNPDGYHYSYNFDRMWRKTRSRSPNGCHGADPNRNWDYNWLKYGATNNSCDYQTFGGLHAFSEKETRTLSEYITGLDHLQGYVAFHADAQMLLVPYSDSVEHGNNYDDLIKIGNASLAAGYKVNGKQYDGPATAAEVLYKASGGSMDWVRNALGTPLVYTFELRGAHFFWPPSRIYEQGDEVTQMMLGLLTEARNLDKASGGSMDWVRNALGTPLVYTFELRGAHFFWPPSRIYEQGDEVTQMMLGLLTEARNLGYF